MFGGHRSEVGVVMLDGDGRQVVRSREAMRGTGRMEIGMAVVGDDLRLDAGQRPHALDRFIEEGAGRGVVEVAEVGREERFIAPRHANRVFVPATESDDGGAGARQTDGGRRVTPPAPDKNRRSRRMSRRPVRVRVRVRVCVCVGVGGKSVAADHRIVRPRDDGAVVPEHGVGDAGESVDGGAVVDDQRLAVRVGAGHHQHQVGWCRVDPRPAGRATGRLVKNQPLQGRIRQHHPERADIGRDAGEPRIARGGLVEQDDRRGDRRQHRPLFRIGAHRRREHGERGGHHGKRLGRAGLAPTQAGDRCGLARVAGEMKATQSLDRDNPA